MAPRTRVIAIVAAAAAGAAALAVGGAVLQGGDEDVQARPPALELAVVVRDDPEARALREAERLYEEGDREEARRRFETLLVRNPQSVEAAVGAAVASWPEGTIERLEALAAEHPASGVVRLNLGLARFAAGDLEAARAEWRAAEEADPDSPGAIRAEDLLHPEFPPGRPFFVADLAAPPGLADLPPQRQLDELERRAEADGVEAWLLYGVSLQRAGRPLSALAAYDRALGEDPESLEAQTAAAVVRFDKDAPSEAFSRLGPLADAHPRAGVVRYHLGLLLLWLRRVGDARRQLDFTVQADPSGFYGREARRLLSRLKGVSAQT